MSLPVPGVGTEPGPQYAQDVNNCLTIIDSHDHTPGSGVQLTPEALNINSDLTMGSNNLTDVRSVRFTAQLAPIANPADLGCLYESGVDLYYNDGVGNQVRITQSGGVAGTPGSIANLTPPASASYVSANSTFVWESDTLTPANMDAASYILRNLVASSFGLTLAPPTLSSDYTITLPLLPASNLPVSVSASGVMSAAQITQAQLNASIQAKLTTPPTVQKFLTGSGTYTLPTSPVAPAYIRLRMVGAGGGGGGATAAAGQGGSGGDTVFGSFTAGGGAGTGGQSSTGSPGGAGGSYTAVGAVGTVINGGRGSSGGAGTFPNGAPGASTPLGSGGSGGQGNSGGFAPAANTGAGGGGAGGQNVGTAGGSGGGGSGAWIDIIIAGPASTYAYSIGVGGTAGPSQGGGAGGAGADGYIEVTEYYGA